MKKSLFFLIFSDGIVSADGYMLGHYTDAQTAIRAAAVMKLGGYHEYTVDCEHPIEIIDALGHNLSIAMGTMWQCDLSDAELEHSLRSE